MTAAVHEPFDALLAGRGGHLHRDDGVVVAMDPGRWCEAADVSDGWLLDRCAGPAIDLGCGPGRLVVALADRGVPALGVDHSPVARMMCRRRGAPMVRRDVFDPLPGEGAWAHVLLVDGNIGVGGDPVRLLARAAALLAPGGTVLVETGSSPGEWWCGTARTCADGTLGDPMPWACVGADALRAVAPDAGLRVGSTSTADESAAGRCFAELVAA
ncbi:MAG: methyltransferase type 12 [Pseudonocardia sp. SCN 73-27]|uniref:methyltransferase domain-containing protein n=1 Tax=unclassified Pseudonocardia TaxID=2619320 RepID=UPI00086B2F5F|nr:MULTISPECIES: class I SAM-dependent methyltransferase [unclassified Pseudonocardia]ODU19542.1 MAG: methyltransferase type 12 [Pseudonocardia sp. SCN 72-51]ODV06566.1 MAG: methyltransferase type 12 [Pseudonocardia sp. SCN 73-27]